MVLIEVVVEFRLVVVADGAARDVDGNLAMGVTRLHLTIV